MSVALSAEIGAAVGLNVTLTEQVELFVSVPLAQPVLEKSEPLVPVKVGAESVIVTPLELITVADPQDPELCCGTAPHASESGVTEIDSASVAAKLENPNVLFVLPPVPPLPSILVEMPGLPPRYVESFTERSGVLP